MSHEMKRRRARRYDSPLTDVLGNSPTLRVLDVLLEKTGEGGLTREEIARHAATDESMLHHIFDQHNWGSFLETEMRDGEQVFAVNHDCALVGALNDVRTRQPGSDNE